MICNTLKGEICTISINDLEKESLANTKNFRFAFGLRLICLQILHVFLVLKLHFVLKPLKQTS